MVAFMREGIAAATSAPTEGRAARRRMQTRIKLLEAGHAVMSEVGVEAAAINEITERADVGFGTFYNYFDSKDALASDVLDCVIHNLGQRNDLAMTEIGETEPVRIVANSVRLVVREIVSEPVWAWWVDQPKLLVDRLRQGHRSFGHRDFRMAIASGDFVLVGDDLEFAWGQLNWLLAGGVRDIYQGLHPVECERQIVEAILRLLGVAHDKASDAVARELPSYPALPVDFSFRLDDG